MLKSKLTPATETKNYPCLLKGKASKAVVAFLEDKVGSVVADPRNVYTNRADGTPHFSNNWEMDMFEPIQEKKEDPKDIEFPCIMQAEDGDVVMLTGTNMFDSELVCGITLHKGHNNPSTNEEVGVSANDWPLDQFRPFKGSVTLGTQEDIQESKNEISKELMDLPRVLKGFQHLEACHAVGTDGKCHRSACTTCAFNSKKQLRQVTDELEELINSFS